MAKSKPSDPNTTRKSSSWSLALLISILTPVAAAIFLYQLDSFDPASLPTHVFSQEPMSVPRINSRLLHESEMIGLGKLLGPEDIAYDTNSHLIYTGCADGWIKKVTLNDSVVHDWAFIGGRPLGVALDHAGEVLVADADKGLLEISEDGVVKLLIDEAEKWIVFKIPFSHLEDGINPDSYKNIQHALLRNPGHATCILNPTAPHKDSDLNEFMHHSLILNKQSTTLPIGRKWPLCAQHAYSGL